MSSAQSLYSSSFTVAFYRSLYLRSQQAVAVWVGVACKRDKTIAHAHAIMKQWEDQISYN